MMKIKVRIFFSSFFLRIKKNTHTTRTNGRDAQSIGRNDVLQAHENAKQQQKE
jgi:hypothetical protein